MIRILLADDQALVRGALAALLDLEADLDVVAQVGRGDEVVAAARSSRAEVCLLDIEMPGLTGLEVAEQLRSELPDVRSLIVTTFGRPGYVRRALDAGAAGFLIKDTPARELADAVRRVHAGLRVVDPDLAAESLMAGPTPLHHPGGRDPVSRARRLTRRGDRRARPPLGRHHSQPPLGRDRQDGRLDQGRSGAGRPVERVDLSRPKTSLVG